MYFILFGLAVCTGYFFPVTSLRTTCRLVKTNILSFIEPIRKGVRKNILMYKFVIQPVQSLIIIG